MIDLDESQPMDPVPDTPTVWLTVLEGCDSNTAENSVPIPWRVQVARSQTLQPCAHHEPFRTSPVFPVRSDFELPDLASSTVYFTFVSFDPAFPVLARLERDIPEGFGRNLFFSLGLASIVVISSAENSIEAIEQYADAIPRSREVWKVVDGTIVSRQWTCSDPAPFPAELLDLPAYDVLPQPARAAVDEFVSCIGLLTQKIATHIPSEVSTFVGLTAKVRELVAEMVYASHPTGTPPLTLSEYNEDDFKRDRSLAETVLHQAWDRLIQINSALSYLPTQSLSGSIPILERRSIIRRHSLLGIGTAALALLRLTRSIERAFAAGAVEDIIENYAPTASPLPGLDDLPSYDASDWGAYSVNRDWYKLEARDAYVKLPYFSHRLGFRETEFTVSAAMQSLSAGADPEWSILTATHEMVHGHVRNILSLMFQGDPSCPPGEKWSRFYERFSAQVTQRGSGGESFIDSLRSIVLTYCCLSQSHGSLTREPTQRQQIKGKATAYNFYLPDETFLSQLLESEFRNISEVIVHVLDLHYFYYSRLTVYIPLVWRSWAPMPQVRGDLRQYLLRTLLVLATKAPGSAIERFKVANRRLQELLEPLASWDQRGAVTITEALAVLRGDRAFETLLPPFSASLILVDLADRVLTSSRIRAAVAQDAHIQIESDPAGMEDRLEYTMPHGFHDAAVDSPAIFLADRLLKQLVEPELPSVEAETLRLFLACASSGAV